MDALINWGNILADSFADIWFKFVGLVPNIIGAVIVFIVGLFIDFSHYTFIGINFN